MDTKASGEQMMETKKKEKIKAVVWTLIPTILMIVVFGGLDFDLDRFAKKTYTECSVEQLKNDFIYNKSQVEEKYMEEYISVKGMIETIDDKLLSLEIISLADNGDIAVQQDEDNDWDSLNLIQLTCRYTDEEQTEQASNLKVGDIVTIKGQVVNIWQYGYLINVDEIHTH